MHAELRPEFRTREPSTHLLAQRVALHAIEVGHSIAAQGEELSPQQLAPGATGSSEQQAGSQVQEWSAPATISIQRQVYRRLSRPAAEQSADALHQHRTSTRRGAACACQTLLHRSARAQGAVSHRSSTAQRSALRSGNGMPGSQCSPQPAQACLQQLGVEEAGAEAAELEVRAAKTAPTTKE
jgi:hypothetical protein